MFESIVTIYLFGEDISKEKLTMNVIKDGKYLIEELPVYEALTAAYNCSLIAMNQKRIFGEI